MSNKIPTAHQLKPEHVIVHVLDKFENCPEGKSALVFGFIYEVLGTEYQIICNNSFEQDAKGMFVDVGMTEEEAKKHVLKNYKKSLKIAINKAKQYSQTIKLKKEMEEDTRGK